MVYSLCVVTVTLVLFCVAQLFRENLQLYEGSPCINLGTGKKGVCKLLRSCPKAIESFRRWQEYPQTCSFVKREPVICCENPEYPKEEPVSQIPVTFQTESTKYTPPGFQTKPTKDPFLSPQTRPTKPPVIFQTLPSKNPSQSPQTKPTMPPISFQTLPSKNPPQSPQTKPTNPPVSFETTPSTNTPQSPPTEPPTKPYVGPILEIYKRPGEVDTEYKTPFNETISYQKCQEYENIDNCPFFISVVGGTKARSGEYAHMALVGYGEPDDKQWKCGGSLVSERFVLTAGHCLKSSEFGDVKYVRLGVLNKNNNASEGKSQDFLVTQTYTPRDYGTASRYNDIALLKLDRDVEFNINVRPGCIFGEFEIEEYQIPTATGWGAVGFTDVDSDDLLYIGLQIQPIDSCSASYQSNKELEFGIDPAIQLCAGGVKGEDTCQGDSGGPLQIRAEFGCSYWIIGVTSFGKSCGVSGVPGVYTRVSAFRPWIEKVVWGQS